MRLGENIGRVKAMERVKEKERAKKKKKERVRQRKQVEWGETVMSHENGKGGECTYCGGESATTQRSVFFLFSFLFKLTCVFVSFSVVF